MSASKPDPTMMLSNPSLEDSKLMLRALTRTTRQLAIAVAAQAPDEALVRKLTNRNVLLVEALRRHRRPQAQVNSAEVEAIEPRLVVDRDGPFQDVVLGGNPLRDWQIAALQAWQQNGCTGVVEAVTGTGKSLVGVAAIQRTVGVDGGQALVVVPTVALLAQWAETLRRLLPGERVGMLGSGSNDSFRASDVLVATVQSASKSPPLPRSLGLLVADEVHRYGSPQYAIALDDTFVRRLGLTATFERQADDGVQQILTPYFGGVTTTYGYGQALRDKVVAPFKLAFVGLDFTQRERREYDQASELCNDSMRSLQSRYGYPEEWADFFHQVTQTLSSDSMWDEETDICNRYMHGFSERRRLTAEARAKEEFVGRIAPTFVAMGGTLVFTETKEGAKALAESISPSASAIAVTSDSPPKERDEHLAAFGRGRIKVLCAPRVLDEGVDVPEAELAVVVATSKTRRQMIQRMGRVIRLKKDGRDARLVMLYIRGTGEDPATGGHEAFLDMVRPHAASEVTFDGNGDDGLLRWLERPQIE